MDGLPSLNFVAGADAQFRAAIDVRPDFAPAHNTLGRLRDLLPRCAATRMLHSLLKESGLLEDP